MTMDTSHAAAALRSEADVRAADAAVPFSLHDDGPLVTVFVPAYNAAAFIATTLRSILAQTYRRLDVVVLDDASTDTTASEVAQFSDPRLRYVRNERNLGQFRTMNRATELARGPVLAIYHADDVYEPGIVAAELAFLCAHPEAGAVFAQDNIIDENGTLLARVSMPAEFGGRILFRYEDVFPYLLRSQNQILCCPTFMVRRSLLASVGPFDAERYKIAADLDMWLRILRRSPVGILPGRLVNYRRSKEQESSKYRRMRTSRDEFFDIVERYVALDDWRPRLSPRDLREYGFHCLDDETFRAANLVILGRPGEAEPHLSASFAWTSLILRPRRRKFRVLLVRTVMRLMLALGHAAPLARLLRWSEYGHRTGVSIRGTVGLS